MWLYVPTTFTCSSAHRPGWHQTRSWSALRATRQVPLTRLSWVTVDQAPRRSRTRSDTRGDRSGGRHSRHTAGDGVGQSSAWHSTLRLTESDCLSRAARRDTTGPVVQGRTVRPQAVARPPRTVGGSIQETAQTVKAGTLE